jgi:hypothetical protein
MWELSTQLGSIFITRLTVSNLTEVLMPRFWNWYRQYKEQLTVEQITERRNAAPREEVESLRSPYGSVEISGTFYEYAELAIQFGYVTLFAAAAPWAPLLAWLSNLAEIYFDSHKIIYETRRPGFHGAQSIGAWMKIFQFLCFFSIVTNSLVLALTSTAISELFDECGDSSTPDCDDGVTAKWLTVMTCEHLLIIFIVFLEQVMDDQNPTLANEKAYRDEILRLDGMYGVAVSMAWDDKEREKEREEEKAMEMEKEKEKDDARKPSKHPHCFRVISARTQLSRRLSTNPH